MLILLFTIERIFHFEVIAKTNAVFELSALKLVTNDRNQTKSKLCESESIVKIGKVKNHLSVRKIR